MLPTEDLFVYVYVLVDDAISSGAIVIATRPGPARARSDAELAAVALVRHLLGRCSEAGFLAEVARDWTHLFPRLPKRGEPADPLAVGRIRAIDALTRLLLYGPAGQRKTSKDLRSVRDFARKQWPPSGAVWLMS